MSRQGQVGKRRDVQEETRQVTSESASQEEKHKAHTHRHRQQHVS